MEQNNTNGLFFDTAAQGWDTPERTSRAKQVAAAIEAQLSSAHIKNAMELGCGTGLVSFFLKDKFESIELIDTSEGMIEVLRQKINEAKLEHMKPSHRDILNEVNATPAYDVIYTSMSMHHIKRTDVLLEKLYQLLKPNGKVFLIDLDEEDGSFHADEPGFDGHNGFNQEALLTLMRETGFEQAQSHIFFRAVKERKAGNVDYALFIASAVKP